jgi:hypothetical protein
VSARVSDLKRTITGPGISLWESGARDVDDVWLQRLDACYEAQGALHGLARALGTPRGLEPRNSWYWNFSGRSGPVWSWLRCEDGRNRIDATLYWGPLRARIEKQCGRLGIIVTAPASISNPPARVELDRPGWVDFGRGRIPRRLGIPKVHGLLHARFYRWEANVRNVLEFTPAEAAEFQRERHRQVDEIMRLLNRPESRRKRSAPPESKVVTVTDLTKNAVPPEEAIESVPSENPWRKLRIARGLSEREAAEQASELEPKLSQLEAFDYKAVSRLETGVAPRNRGKELRSRLDTLYAADGQLCREPVEVERLGEHEWTATFRGHWEGLVRTTKWRAAFPRYWVGPIWVICSTKSGMPAAAFVLLRVEPWRKPLKMASGMSVTTRWSGGTDAAFYVETPTNWEVSAGVGVDRAAVDVQEGWSATGEHGALSIYHQIKTVADETIGSTASSFRRAVRSLRG